MIRSQRIGIYGGTFDPIHTGHLAVADGVSEFFELDELFFVPAYVAPHKVGQQVTAPLHRYAMLVLATEDRPQQSVSTFELEAEGAGYTIDTLGHFQRTLGPDAELFFLMGADSWEEIATWREWEQLMTMVNHVIVTRPGHQLAVQHLPTPVTEQIIDLRGLQKEGVQRAVANTQRPKIFLTDLARVDVSATEIRRETANGRINRLSTMVPARVADYIEKYNLYKKTNEAKSNR